MDITEVIDLCKHFSSMARENEQGLDYKTGAMKLRKDHGIPEYYPGYNHLVDLYRQCKTHAYGEFPDELFAANKPLQTEEEFDYIRQTYQPHTKDTFVEFSNTVKRSLTNGHIRYQTAEEAEIAFKKYLEEELGHFKSLWVFAPAMVDEKLIDGNGVVGLWVEGDTTEQTDEDGETKLVYTGVVRPYPVIYTVEQAIWSEDDDILVETAKKSLVDYGNTKHKIGRVYRYFGKDYIAEITQVGKYTDNEFAVSYEFYHELGYTPARKLMGLPKIIQNELYWDSIFNLAVPHLNNAALDGSNLLSIKNKAVYPTRVVVREKCDYHDSRGDCDGGMLRWNNGETFIEETCPSCKGTGSRGVFGIFDEISVNQTASGIDDNRNNKFTAQDVMAYVAPSIEIPKFISEQVDEHTTKAEQTLHLKAEPRSSGDISATEKNQDAKNTESFIKPISDQIWYLLDFIIYTTGRIQYGHDFDEMKPEIVKPSNFDLVTPSDIILEIGEAKKAGMPDAVIQSMVINYFMASSKHNRLQGDKYDLLVDADRLIGATNEQVAIGLSRNLIQPWEAILHMSGAYFIEALIEENEGFMELDRSEQINQIKARAQSLVPTSDIALPQPQEF